MEITKNRFTILLLFILAFVIRFIYLHEFSRFPTFYHLNIDQQYYHLWAQRIIKEGILGEDIYEMTPLYAYFLAFLYRFITEDLYIIRLIQIFIGSLTVVFVYLLAHRLFNNQRIAVISGLFASFYGLFILYDGMVMKTFLAVFFAVLALYWLTKVEGGKPIEYLLPGIFIGFVSLVRENALLLIGGIPLCFFIKEGVNLLTLKRSVIFAVGAFIVILPITLRNYWVGKEFVPITAGGGQVFYIGSYDGANGAYAPPPFLKNINPLSEHEEYRQEAMKRAGKQLTRKESSDFWYDEGFKYIKENPKRFVYLLYRKFINFWNFYEHPDNQNLYFMRSITTVLKFTLGFGIIAPLGILGIATTLKDWRRFLILYTFLFVYLLSILIMYNIARYRIPAVPVLIVFAASYLHWLYCSFRKGRFRNSFVSIIFLVPLFIGVNCRIDGIDPYRLYFATEYSKMGKSYLTENRFSEAKESYNSILKIDSNSLDGYLGLGRVAMKERNFPEAVKHFQKAITIDPGNYRSYLNLAIAYREVGKISEAQEMLNKAVRLNPNIWKMGPSP